MSPLAGHLMLPLALLATDPLAEFHAAPRCPSRAPHCIGLQVHIALERGAPVQTPRWLAGQISEANRVFEPLGVGFELDGLHPNGSQWADIDTRLKRDQLGRRDRDGGVVHVFMVRRLGDVDLAGEEIRGVHWRDRAEPSQRWIILSALGSHRVLAHELGHFFGLRHSGDPASIMNKQPRDRPPPEKRGFPPAELERMRRHLGRMLRDGTLVARNKGAVSRSRPR